MGSVGPAAPMQSASEGTPSSLPASCTIAKQMRQAVPEKFGYVMRHVAHRETDLRLVAH